VFVGGRGGRVKKKSKYRECVKRDREEERRKEE